MHSRLLPHLRGLAADLAQQLAEQLLVLLQVGGKQNEQAKGEGDATPNHDATIPATVGGL